MAASSRKALGRRLGVLVAGAVVATSLTAASAVAATSAPIGMQATGPTRPGADASPDRRAGTPPPGSCWSGAGSSRSRPHPARRTSCR